MCWIWCYQLEQRGTRLAEHVSGSVGVFLPLNLAISFRNQDVYIYFFVRFEGNEFGKIFIVRWNYVLSVTEPTKRGFLLNWNHRRQQSAGQQARGDGSVHHSVTNILDYHQTPKPDLSSTLVSLPDYVPITCPYTEYTSYTTEIKKYYKRNTSDKWLASSKRCF